MKLFTAPEIPETYIEEPLTLFLAGSIEMDKASNWQAQIISEMEAYPVAIWNPRREKWDPTWLQEIDNPEFAEQVNWELDHIEHATITFMYLEPGTMSPISLMELGLLAGLDRREDRCVIVVCPPGFWRRGNVQIICDRHDFICAESLEEGVQILKETIAIYLQTYFH